MFDRDFPKLQMCCGISSYIAAWLALLGDLVFCDVATAYSFSLDVCGYRSPATMPMFI